MSAEIFNLEDGDWVYDKGGTYFAYCSDGTLYVESRSSTRCLSLLIDEVRILRNLLGKEIPDGTPETQE